MTGKARQAKWGEMRIETLHTSQSRPVPAAARRITFSDHGAVLGAGAELAMTMDFRVSADNLNFRLPEINYGLVVDTGGSNLAMALAGPSRAKWLIMSGEAVGAADALAWGLADWVVPLAELDARAFSIAHTLAGKPPRAMAMAKGLINDAWEGQLLSGLKQELLAQCVLFEGAEFAATRDARVGKKKGG